MQCVRELEQPLVLAVNIGLADGVFVFPLKKAHAGHIGSAGENLIPI
jgi:hypothetical protein